MTILRQLLVSVTVRMHAMELVVSGGAVAGLGQPEGGIDSCDVAHITRSVSVTLRRVGMQTKLLVDTDANRAREPDRSLVRLLARAHQFRQAVMTHQGRTMRDLAGEAGVGPSYFARVLRLAFLAPDLVDDMVRGRQPEGLTANKLQDLRLPNAWADQRAQLEGI